VLNAASAVTLSGELSGPGNLVKGGSSELTLSGVNTFSGTVAVNAGSLSLVGGSALLNSATVSVNAGGTLNLAASEEFGALAGAGSVLLQGNTLTLGGAAASTFSGVMSGTGGLVKNGLSALTLSGVNSFSGGVRLSAGALQVGSNLALGSGTLVFTGGTLSVESVFERALAFARDGGCPQLRALEFERQCGAGG
jgi:autotransporter-associated beta strand protein